MKYQIRQINCAPNWESIAPASIREYNWGGGYRPDAEARLCFQNGNGFFLRMRCLESNPRRVYFGNNDPVYRDSCLEFFVNFKPQRSNSGYLNFECNANGALLCEYGQTRETRRYLTDLGIAVPNVKPFQEADAWGYELFLPLRLIAEIYGDASFHTGDGLTGNFYKCGDDTQFPHFGSWTRIGSPKPNFHLPEYFGTLEIC